MFEQEEMSLTPKERANAVILTVEPDRNERQNIRTALKQLGFGGITDCPTHSAALEKMQERRITHIIFDAKKTNMPTTEFVSKVVEYDPNVVLIPASFEPNVDDVFDLLVLGARGYLCKPFTVDTVDAAVVAATKGEPIADSVKQAKDRNEALVAIMMASLDKAATIMRQAKQFDTAKREIPRAMRGFRVSAELAQTFAKGGQDGLFEALERFCIERSKGPATRLGRLRKRLKTKPARREGSPNTVSQ
ncbi:MAG: response regulator [Bdellovibrionales bacterium]|nr:response regulator [Bdellovibrionales bacterium]